MDDPLLKDDMIIALTDALKNPNMMPDDVLNVLKNDLIEREQ